MNVQKRNGVAIYCLSSGPQLPEWLGDQARRNLAKRDENVRRRIDLIQDFQMPASSSKLLSTRDGRYIIAAGTYPPRIRCYDVNELAMKFERYTDAGIVDMVSLSDDYGKVALLREDRTIDFHAPYGHHESVRIPTFGRAMAYEPTTCDLLIAAKGNQVFRINLEEGRFAVPWSFDTTTAESVSTTCITVDPCHPLAAVGCDDGMVRFWDSRSPETITPFLKLDVQSATKGHGFADDFTLASGRNPGEVTAMAHDPSGLHMTVGTAGGVVALYDIRSSRPLHLLEHKHGLPIHTIKFHAGSGMVLSSDEKLIKIWRYRTSISHDTVPQASTFDMVDHHHGELGSVLVNLEGSGKLSNFIVAGDEKDPNGDRSGIVLCASDQPKIETYFLPGLGVAPKWCSFVESITEELEEKDLEREGATGSGLPGEGQETVYENYKFVSRDDVEKLGISNLIGTPLLRGYMHGFFMDVNLYNRVRAVANPFEYEEYQKKKLRERLESKRSSRIAPKESQKVRTKVNPDLAERLQSKASGTKKSNKIASELLNDNRFGRLFTNPDFEIDEDDENFKLRNPSGVAAAKQKENNLDSDVSDEEDDDSEPRDTQGNRSMINSEKWGTDDENDFSDYNSSDEDEDGFKGGRVRGEAYDEVYTKKKEKTSNEKRAKPRKNTKVSMLETEVFGNGGVVSLGLGDESAASRARRRLEEMTTPLAKRLAAEGSDDKQIKITKNGSKEVSYIPKSDKIKMAKADAERNSAGSKRERRSIRDLKRR